jgi:O-antigen/teichoic acid export membrane protein
VYAAWLGVLVLMVVLTLLWLRRRARGRPQLTPLAPVD